MVSLLPWIIFNNRRFTITEDWFYCNIYETALKLELCFTIKTALQVGALYAVLEATSFQLLPSTGIPPVVLLVTDCPGLHCGARAFAAVGSEEVLWSCLCSSCTVCWVPNFLCLAAQVLHEKLWGGPRCSLWSKPKGGRITLCKQGQLQQRLQAGRTNGCWPPLLQSASVPRPQWPPCLVLGSSRSLEFLRGFLGASGLSCCCAKASFQVLTASQFLAVQTLFSVGLPGFQLFALLPLVCFSCLRECDLYFSSAIWTIWTIGL